MTERQRYVYVDKGGYIFKADRDVDLYVRWSSISDNTDPISIGTRAEFLAAGCGQRRLDLADEFGSSDDYMVEEYGRTGGWEDDGLVVHNVRTRDMHSDYLYWLPRKSLLQYCQLLMNDGREAAERVLERRHWEK